MAFLHEYCTDAITLFKLFGCGSHSLQISAFCYATFHSILWNEDYAYTRNKTSSTCNRVKNNIVVLCHLDGEKMIGSNHTSVLGSLAYLEWMRITAEQFEQCYGISAILMGQCHWFILGGKMEYLLFGVEMCLFYFLGLQYISCIGISLLRGGCLLFGVYHCIKNRY